MKRRWIAGLLAGLLLVQTTACGQAGAAVDQTTESVQEQTAETESQTETTDEAASALSLMQQVNRGEENIIDDNYRNYYEVFVYSFYDSDGDGIGDLNGLTEKLDYINDGDPETDTDLGCNGIWLMPVMPSTTYHKYDVTDYEAIDPEYGTMEDFENFLAEAHDRGIHVILDLVMNHTSSKHEWFQTAYAYLQGLSEGEEPDAAECPYVDYYNFSKEKKSGYYQVEGTDWYYEGQFWSEMPDLNWDCEAVKDEFTQITKFWLDLGVDGFRLDAVKEFYTGADEKNIQVLTWFNDMVKAQKEDAYLVGEAWNDSSVYAKYYQSGMDSFFDFAYADSDGIIADTIKKAGGYNASSYGKALVSTEELLGSYSDSYIDAPFYTNHDMARSAGYYSGEDSEAQTKMGNAMNLLMSGSTFLYYGEELGMKGSGKDENKRAPMYWSTDAGSEGMCDGPKDMDTVKMKYGSLEEQEVDGNSIYQYVKQILQLKNLYPEIAHGSVKFYEELSDENVCVIEKIYGEELMTIVFNISGETQQVDVREATYGTASDSREPVVCGELLTGTEPVTIDGTELTMPAYSVVLLKP